MADETTYWETIQNGRRHRGKAKTRLAMVEWMGKHYADIRVVRLPDHHTGPGFTREGVRFPIEEAKDVMKALKAMIEDYTEIETLKRQKGDGNGVSEDSKDNQ
jgi:hypothetical protein